MKNAMVLDLHYTEPELVALYDQQNPRGEDFDFYLNLASSRSADTVLDLGCGTGLLACEFAGKGHSVTAVDPAETMLDFARKQRGAAAVTWVLGDANALGCNAFDLAVMTGNVAQIFLTDQSWQDTLTAINKSLHTGGYLAFESRNPRVKAWQGWIPSQTRCTYDSPVGSVESWLQLTSADEGRVCFAQHCQIHDSDNYYVINSELRFRCEVQLCKSLEQCGFRVEQVYGNWQSGPLQDTSRSMIFVAQKIA